MSRNKNEFKNAHNNNNFKASQDNNLRDHNEKRKAQDSSCKDLKNTQEFNKFY